MSRKIQRLAFPQKKTPRVEQAVGVKLPAVNFSP